MTEITLATKHTIVSMAARGRRTQDIADRTTLPVATVRSIAEEYGAPDMGKLAWAADELRKQLDKETTHPSAGAAVADSVDFLKAQAEKVGATRLVKRAERIGTLLDQLRVDLKAAVAAWEADAAARAEREAAAAAAKAARQAEAARVKAERQAKLDRLAALKAEEAKLRAELKPTAKALTHPQAVREWAAANGIEAPARGRLPQKVLDAYAGAVK